MFFLINRLLRITDRNLSKELVSDINYRLNNNQKLAYIGFSFHEKNIKSYKTLFNLYNS